jgi:hypothetical protein
LKVRAACIFSIDYNEDGSNKFPRNVDKYMQNHRLLHQAWPKSWYSLWELKSFILTILRTKRRMVHAKSHVHQNGMGFPTFVYKITWFFLPNKTIPVSPCNSGNFFNICYCVLYVHFFGCKNINGA